MIASTVQGEDFLPVTRAENTPCARPPIAWMQFTMKSLNTLASRRRFSFMAALVLSTPTLGGDFLPDFDSEPGKASLFWAAFTTTGPFIATTLTFKKLSGNDEKRLVLARDDAAAFVASDAAIRGVQLESALLMLRQERDLDRYDDLALARAILGSTD